jgi:tetratricopeptide (TPR) repeat protein
MEPRLPGEAEREFERARQAVYEDNTVAALSSLEKALRLDDNPSWYSFFGYCVAKERGQVRKGVDLCQASLELEPDHPDHYLNLGRIYMVAGNKPEALRIWREGLGRGESAQIRRLLGMLGKRQPPLFPALHRSNPLNRYLGFILSRLGLR